MLLVRLELSAAAQRRYPQRRPPAGVYEGGGVVIPGQHAGFLAPRHDPWQVTRDPTRRLPRGWAAARSANRRGPPRRSPDAADHVDGQRENLARTAEGRRLSDQQQQAYSILTSGKIAKPSTWSANP